MSSTDRTFDTIITWARAVFVVMLIAAVIDLLIHLLILNPRHNQAIARAKTIPVTLQQEGVANLSSLKVRPAGGDVAGAYQYEITSQTIVANKSDTKHDVEVCGPKIVFPYDNVYEPGCISYTVEPHTIARGELTSTTMQSSDIPGYKVLKKNQIVTIDYHPVS